MCKSSDLRISGIRSNKYVGDSSHSKVNDGTFANKHSLSRASVNVPSLKSYGLNYYNVGVIHCSTS